MTFDLTQLLERVGATYVFVFGVLLLGVAAFALRSRSRAVDPGEASSPEDGSSRPRAGSGEVPR